MSQPGCVAFDASGERLFEWFLQPAKANGLGAKSRVEPDDVLSIVLDRLEGRTPAVAEPRVDEQASVLEAIIDAGMFNKKRPAA